MHFNSKISANLYISCDSSDFWRGTDGSNRSLPEAQHSECQQTRWEKKSFYSACVCGRWGATEKGTTTFLLRSSGNGVTCYNKALMPQDTDRSKQMTTALKYGLLAINF